MKSVALTAILVATISVAACSGSSHTKSPPPSTTPSSVGEVSLSGWKLTLPVDSSGRLSGTAAVQDPAAPSPPWLSRTPSGGLEFWAPAAGAKTAHSKHSRTELVSTSEFAIGSSHHTLSATVQVTKLPANTPDIAIGQIHMPGPVPYLLLHYESGRILATWRTSRDGSTKAGDQQIVAGVPLNSTFSYNISANTDDTVDIAVTHNGATTTKTLTVPPAFRGTPGRFQAGDYQQATTSTGADDGGRVVFIALSAT